MLTFNHCLVKLKSMQILPRKKTKSGQILLIVLLIIAVALTISLSVISGSSSDLNISQGSEEAARAFSAAEAGIEQVLLTAENSGVVEFTDSGVTYEAITESLGAGNEFAFPGEYTKDSIMTLWLANYNQTNGIYTKVLDDSFIRIVWGNPDSGGTVPAIETSIYYKDGATYKVGRFALDPISRPTDNPSCSGVNCFCRPDGTYCQGLVTNFRTSGTEVVDEKNFRYGATLNISAFRGGVKTLLFARLRLLYSDQPQFLGAKTASGANFPAQGVIITSVGQSGNSTRKVQVKRLNPVPPSFLDFLIYSGSNLTHQ